MLTDKLPFKKNSFLYVVIFFSIAFLFQLIAFCGSCALGFFSFSGLIGLLIYCVLFFSIIFGMKKNQKLFKVCLVVLTIIFTFALATQYWVNIQNLGDQFQYNVSFGMTSLFEFFVSIAMLIAFVTFIISYIFDIKVLREIGLICCLVSVFLLFLCFICAMFGAIQINNSTAYPWTNCIALFGSTFCLLGIYCTMTSSEAGF